MARNVKVTCPHCGHQTWVRDGYNDPCQRCGSQQRHCGHGYGQRIIYYSGDGYSSSRSRGRAKRSWTFHPLRAD